VIGSCKNMVTTELSKDGKRGHQRRRGFASSEKEGGEEKGDERVWIVPPPLVLTD